MELSSVSPGGPTTSTASDSSFHNHLADATRVGSSVGKLLPKVRDLTSVPRKTKERRRSWTGVDNAAFRADSSEDLYAESDKGNQTPCLREIKQDECDRISYVHQVHLPREEGCLAWTMVACALTVSGSTLGLLSCYGVLLTRNTTLLFQDHPSKNNWIWTAAAAHSLYSFTHPAFDLLMERASGSRWLSAFFTCLGSLMFLVCYNNSIAIWLFAALIMPGIGASACSSASMATIRSHISGPRTQLAISLGQGGTAVGLLFWPAVLAYPKSRTTLLLVLSGIIGIATIFVLVLLRDPSPLRYRTIYVKSLSVKNTVQEYSNPPSMAVRRTWSAILVLTGSVIEVATIFILLLLPEFLARGSPDIGVATLFGFCGCGCLVGRLFGGWMLEHDFVPVLYCYHLAQGAGGAAGMALIFCNQISQAAPTAAISGLAFGVREALHSSMSEKPFKDTNSQQPNIVSITFAGHILRGLLVLIAPFASENVFLGGTIVEPLIFFGSIAIFAAVIASLTSCLFMWKHKDNDLI